MDLDAHNVRTVHLDRSAFTAEIYWNASNCTFTFHGPAKNSDPTKTVDHRG